MRTLVTVAAAALMLSAGAATAAMQPGAYGPVPAAGPAHRTPAQAARARTSYGVGYHGRTSATGGPVGGYPSRN